MLQLTIELHQVNVTWLGKCQKGNRDERRINKKIRDATTAETKRRLDVLLGLMAVRVISVCTVCKQETQLSLGKANRTYVYVRSL